MYKDLISYELADGVSEEHLLKVAREIIDSWMKNLPGFISWEINKTNTGIYTDIVYWESEEDAKNAEKEMANIPNAADWYGCYAPGSIKGTALFQLAIYKDK